MKRILSIILCALVLLGLCPPARAAQETTAPAEETVLTEEAQAETTAPTEDTAPTEEAAAEETTPEAPAEAGPVSIATRADMLKLAENPSGAFALVRDIDMGGEAWTPLPFSGTLEGHGHTLYNLTVTAPGPDTAITFDGNRKEYETVFGGLFSVVRDATIREVNLVGAAIQVETDRHCFLGGLAGFAEHSVIESCAVQTRNHLTLTSVNAGVGGLIGFSLENEIRNCTVDGELIFTDTNKDTLCEEFLGGVFASGSGHVDGCAVRTRGFAEVYGYAHSGGIIGMYKGVKGSKYRAHVNDTTADTEISFFEVTKSRRAYCSPTIGEDLKREVSRKNMTVDHYVRREAKKPTRLSPEKCEAPAYTLEITPGACTAWGYTTHTCAVCGYSFRDSYTPPAHQYTAAVTKAPACTEAGEQTMTCAVCGDSYVETLPATGHEYRETVTPPTCTEEGTRLFTCVRGDDQYAEAIPATGHTPEDWTLTLAPAVNTPGEEQRRCAVCGQVLERREVAALPYIYAEQLTLRPESLTLTVGQEIQLAAVLTPADATDPEPLFSSADERVARVAPDGTVQAVAPGQTTITCASADGRATAACPVTVSYTAGQWIKHYVLFGWLWE